MQPVDVVGKISPSYQPLAVKFVSSNDSVKRAVPDGGGTVAVSDAEHVAVEPPPVPAQVHVHGPEPLTREAAPTEQRLVVGVVETVVPLAEPHTPLVGVTATGGAEGVGVCVAPSKPINGLPCASVFGGVML